MFCILRPSTSTKRILIGISKNGTQGGQQKMTYIPSMIGWC